MNKNYIKMSLLLVTVLFINSPICAESLFKSGVTENAYTVQPKPLFSTVRAKSVGDIVTINISEAVSTSDTTTFSDKDSSSLTNNFSSLWNQLLPFKLLPTGLNNFGGSTTVNKQAATTRATTLTDVVTTQVVQILPNGNLLVQGKKTSINAKERLELVISGIVDPRLLDSTGAINSNLVANLQVAVTGKGDVSTSASESPIMKYVRYLF